jgi:hypothetical protein
MVPNIPIWVNYGSAMIGVCKFIGRLFYCHFVCIHIVCPFGIFCGHLGRFLPFWYVAPSKIWQPWSIHVADFVRCFKDTTAPLTKHSNENFLPLVKYALPDS